MNKQKLMLKLEFGKLSLYINKKKVWLFLQRYVVPSTIEIDYNLPTLGDHLKKYIKSNDQPIIMYLHGQDGTR